MSSWPFSFEAETELEEELRRRRGRRPWPVRRPAVRPYRRPAVYAAPVFREPVYLEPPPPEPIEEPVDGPPEEEPVEEIHISKGCMAVLERAEAVSAGDVYDEKKKLPVEPGLYVIRRAGRAIYVGIAENSIHSRFQQRYKSLRDFGLDSAILSGVTVTSYALKSRTPSCVASRKPKSGGRLTAVSPKEGLLRVLEQHFIKHFKTGKTAGGKYGNSGSEAYTFGPGEKVSLRIANRATTDPPADVS
jgi:hypothetical protein